MCSLNITARVKLKTKSVFAVEEHKPEGWLKFNIKLFKKVISVGLAVKKNNNVKQTKYCVTFTAIWLLFLLLSDGIVIIHLSAC